MKRLFLISILAVSLSLSISCSKDNDGKRAKLPAVTTEGKNTFGCRVNGEIFVPKSKGGFNPTSPLVAKYYYHGYSDGDYLQPGYYLFLNAFNRDTQKNIDIMLAKSDVPLVQGQTYPIVLKADAAVNAQYSFYSYTPHPEHSNVSIFTTHEYKTTNEYSGQLKILKIDEANFIISGTFSFDAINSVNGKTASITEGRFDVKYFLY